MNSTVNLGQIITCNVMGLILGGLTWLSCLWKLRRKTRENQLIKAMLVIVLFACITDPIGFIADGGTQPICGVLVYVCNFFLFLTNIMIGPIWVSIICEHIIGGLSKAQKIIIGVMTSIGIFTLLLNIFVPIVFYVDAQNRYQRGVLFFIFVVIEVILVLDGIWVYVHAKMKGRVLKFFPVMRFIFPMVAGLLIQNQFYGLSTIYPFMMISIAGLMLGLQNETVYKDALTGLYNRFYLDKVREDFLNGKGGSNLTAMMLDLNDFKSINDSYGHSVGDEALKDTAMLLRKGVAEWGSVVRYAGDEFVILLNTVEESDVQDCVDRIKSVMDDFNIEAKREYRLSVAIGYAMLDMKKQSIDELLKEIDAKMYEDKQRYYQTNPEKNRRKNRG